MPVRDPRPTFSNGTVYYGRFQTTWEGVDTLVIIKIAQKSTFSLDTLSVLVTLNDERDRLPEGSLVIKTVDNDDDPLNPIKAKQAIIKFFSQNSVSLKSFAKGESDEWVTLVYLNTEDAGHLLFQGFLVMDVASEPYDPKPYEVTLTATDNLGLLKNIPLTDFEGNNPTNENKIIKYLAWALSKTNMSLPIYVSNNLMEENNPSLPFYESCYLHAKTFEKELTNTGAVSEDCSTVITKILGNDSRIMQRNGAWWIERIYEKNANPAYVHQFSYDGTYIGVASPAFYQETIDFRGLIDFVNDSAQVTIKSPYKKAVLTYNNEYPKEIIDNIDFSRGDLFFPLAMPPVVIDGQTYYQGKYHINDWQALEGSSGTPGTGSPSTTNNYIRRLFSDSNRTYEVERYVVIEGTLSGGMFFLKDNKIPVNKNDKFDISVDTRASVDAYPSSGSYRLHIIQVRLYGNDGSFYTLHGGSSVDKTLKWYLTDSSFHSNGKFFVIEGNTSEDMTAWKTSAFITDSTDPNPCPQIPVDGKLEILLLHDQNSTIQTDRYFNNLRFTYIPFINGSYSKYAGQTNTVSQTGNYSNVLEAQIYINNAPSQLMKGALLRQNGAEYSLAGQFYDGQAFPSGLPSIEFLHPLGYHLVYSVWQLLRRHMGSIDGDMVGLKCGSPLTVPDLYKVFLFTNSNPHVDNKFFMLLHYEQDFDTQIWRAYFTENLDTTIGYVFTDPYEFKYITG